MVAELEVARAGPNAFVVVDEHLAAACRGPLRRMLVNAFLDDETAVDNFIADVVDRERCWTLPIWTDDSRLALKAARRRLTAPGA